MSQWFRSREPTHWSQAIFRGSLWSEGRIRWPAKGPEALRDALELQAGDHVGIMGVVIGLVLLGIIDRKARGQDDRAHLQLQLFRSQLVGHGPGLAGLGALHAFGADAAVDAAGRFFHGLLLLDSPG